MFAYTFIFNWWMEYGCYTCKYHAVVVSKCRGIDGTLPSICINVVHPQGSVNPTSDFGILHATYAEYGDVTYIFLLEMCANVVWVMSVFTSLNTAYVCSPVIALALLHLLVFSLCNDTINSLTV